MPTWDDFREWGTAGWIFLPPFPQSATQPLDSSVVTVEDEGGVFFFFNSRRCGWDYGSLLFVVCWNRREGTGVLVGLFRGLLPRANWRGDQSRCSARFTSRDDNWKPAPFHIQPVGNGVEGLNIQHNVEPPFPAHSVVLLRRCLQNLAWTRLNWRLWRR